MKKLLISFLIKGKRFISSTGLCLLIFVLSLNSLQINSQTTKIFNQNSSYYGMISSSGGYSSQSNSLYVGYYSTYGETNRGYIEFDISTIPSNATITAASLNLKCTGAIGTNTNTGGNVIFENLDYRQISFFSSADWSALSGSSKFTTVAVDLGGTITISGTDLITKIKNNVSSGYLYFGLVNSAESSNGIYFSTFTSDLYLSVTYTIPATIPSTPTNLIAKNITSSGCSLSWATSTGAPTGYKIYYGTNVIQTSSNSIDITGLSPETPYSFTVSAVNSMGESAKSSPLNVTTLPLPPSTPTGLAASGATCSGVNLSWSAPSGTISGYYIYQNGVLKTTVLSPATTVNYSDLSSNTSYSFTISAYNSGGNSAQSAGVPITTNTAPAVPYAFHPTSVSSSSIGLTWDAVSGATLYYLYLYCNGNFFTKIATSNTYFSSNGFNGAYCFYVTSYNGICESQLSYGICYTFVFSGSATLKSTPIDSKEAFDVLPEKSVDIYPNPVLDKLYVNDLTDFDATIFDLSGKKVLSVLKANGSIDVSGLAQGVYIIQLSNADKTITRKIIKQ